MRRVVGYLILAVLVVAAALWFAARPGAVSVDWLGWRVDTSVPLLLLLLAIALAVVIVVFRVIAGIFGLPGGIGRAYGRRQQRKGLDALGYSVSALFAGEPDKAHKRASEADKALSGTSAGRVLLARAALARNETADAIRLHEGLLGDPQTEIVGLRGLIETAAAEDRTADVDAYATRALVRAPKAAWASEALLAAKIKTGAWDDVVRTLETGTKNAAFARADSSRLIAVARLAEAAAGSSAEAARTTKKAVEADPALVPAVVAHAEALYADGSARKALKVIEDAWKRTPHPDLARAYLGFFRGEEALQRVTRAQHLADFNPDHLESRLLVAEAAIAASLWGQARARLKPLIDGGVQDQRVAVLSARLDEQEHGDHAGAVQWLQKAIAWGPPPAWRCTACGTPSTIWAPRCPTCGTFASLAWPTGRAVAVAAKS